MLTDCEGASRSETKAAALVLRAFWEKAIEYKANEPSSKISS